MKKHVNVKGGMMKEKLYTKKISGHEYLCIHKKDLSKNETVIGYIYINKLKKEDVDLANKKVRKVNFFTKWFIDEYIYVQKNNTYLGILNVDLKFLLILCLTCMLFCGTTTTAVVGTIQKLQEWGLLPVTHAQNNNEIEVNQTEYDDSHIEFGDSNNENANEEQGEILFNVYGDFAIKVGNGIPLTNPSTNTVTFVYSVIDDNNNVIYQTDHIEPGKQVSWKVSDYLDVGKTHIILNVDAYDIETGIQCRGFWFDIDVTVE